MRLSACWVLAAVGVLGFGAPGQAQLFKRFEKSVVLTIRVPSQAELDPNLRTDQGSTSVVPPTDKLGNYRVCSPLAPIAPADSGDSLEPFRAFSV